MKYTGQTREDLIAMQKPEAEKRVRAELVIDAIRKAEKIEPTEADIEKAIEDQAKRTGQETETFKNNLTDEQKEYLKDNAAIQLVLDLLKKDAKIAEKKEEKEEKKPAVKKTTKKAEKADDEAKEEKKPAAKKTTKKADKAEEEAKEEKEEKPAKKPAAKKTAKKAEPQE